MREIRERITSENIDVLEQCLRFARECSNYENERGKIAESRATAMLALLGILAGFIVPLAESISNTDSDSRRILFFVFSASLIFLVKGIYYAVRVLSVSIKYRLVIEAVYDFQPLSKVEALREEIAGVIWECEKATQPNTKKLFHLNRCQRSGITSIILFITFGILLISLESGTLKIPEYLFYIICLMLTIILFFTDTILEHIGIWGNARNIRYLANRPPDH